MQAQYIAKTLTNLVMEEQVKVIKNLGQYF
jgi:hypothetical protein